MGLEEAAPAEGGAQADSPSREFSNHAAKVVAGVRRMSVPPAGGAAAYAFFLTATYDRLTV